MVNYMELSKSFSGARITVVASWLILLVLLTVILQTLSFLFIPLCKDATFDRLSLAGHDYWNSHNDLFHNLYIQVQI